MRPLRSVALLPSLRSGERWTMEGLSCNYRSPLSWAQGKSSRLRDLRFLYQGIIYFCSRNDTQAWKNWKSDVG